MRGFEAPGSRHINGALVIGRIRQFGCAALDGKRRLKRRARGAFIEGAAMATASLGSLTRGQG
jgi:hypothetical protein